MRNPPGASGNVAPEHLTPAPDNAVRVELAPAFEPVVNHGLIEGRVSAQPVQRRQDVGGAARLNVIQRGAAEMTGPGFPD